MQIDECRLLNGRLIGAIALTAVLSSSAVYAQQTTTQSGAAQSAAAPEPAEQERVGDDASFVDRAQAWAKDHQIMERLNGEVDGWYPLGSWPASRLWTDDYTDVLGALKWD